MAIPKVFVSSTCYDLKYIRENLRYFINSIGFDAVLSEDGDVFYNPQIHTHDACLNEVNNCQLFVLIIGGRYGGTYHGEEKSITNKEYEKANELKIPIFTLVEQSVLSDHYVYQKNRKNPDITYPNVDSIKIFSFIDEVRKSESNNAIVPFSNFNDIETYLKKQWAGMMYDFLTNQNETRKVKDLFEEIHNATEKIELYTKQLAVNTGDDNTSLLIDCYNVMVTSKIISAIGCWNIKSTPQMILSKETLDDFCNNNILIESGEGYSMTWGGPPYRCTKLQKQELDREYLELRTQLQKLIMNTYPDVNDFLEKIKT
jgi:hypothetical protein